MDTVFLVAGVFISESTHDTASAYPAIYLAAPGCTRVHSFIQELVENRTSLNRTSEDMLRSKIQRIPPVLGGSFWPYSREYLSHAVPEQYRQPGTAVPSEAVNTVVPADSGTAGSGTPA